MYQEELSLAAEGFATDIVFGNKGLYGLSNIFIEKSQHRLFPSDLVCRVEKVHAYPQEPVNTDAAVEIENKRDCFMESIQGEGQLYEGTTSHHSIIVTDSNLISDSPLERTVIVNIVNDWHDILNFLFNH